MIKVRVPATSANMGPGFDSLGVAASLYNEFGFKVTEGGLTFKGFLEEFCNEDNIVYTSMVKCFERANVKVPGLEISELKQDVPVSRGLGSSSTCIVAGLVAANEILGNKFSKDEIFKMSVEIEGHPDNVAPAVFGGMVVSVMDGKEVYFDKVNIKKDFKLVPIVPNFRLSTSEARSVLPTSISMKDGVYNLSRAALMVSALTNGRLDLLKRACTDSFHENYRSKLIKGFDEVREEAYRLGALASYLSGAGPTIMALVDKDDNEFAHNMQAFLKKKSLEWTIFELSIDTLGAVVIGEK